jgi:hypothetical protein
MLTNHSEDNRTPSIKLFTLYTQIIIPNIVNRIVEDRHGPIQIFIVLFVRNLCLFHV